MLEHVARRRERLPAGAVVLARVLTDVVPARPGAVRVRRYVGNGTPSVLDPREKPTWQTRRYIGAAPAISN